MVSKKYLKDYRLEEQIDSSGRIKTKAIYIGEYYDIVPDYSISEKRMLFCLSMLAGLSFIGALIPVSQATRVIYVSLPFIFSALPLFIMISTLVSFIVIKDPMKREQAERISNRLPAGAFISMILSTAAFAGQIITALVSWDSFPAGDAIFAILSFTVGAISAIIFIKCRNMKIINSRIA